jgi:hypothetical protein
LKLLFLIFKVKDQSFQPNVELKKAKLEKLQELLKEIAAKEPEFSDLGKQAAVEENIETQTIVSQLSSRFQGLSPATQVGRAHDGRNSERWNQ